MASLTQRENTWCWSTDLEQVKKIRLDLRAGHQAHLQAAWRRGSKLPRSRTWGLLCGHLHREPWAKRADLPAVFFFSFLETDELPNTDKFSREMNWSKDGNYMYVWNWSKCGTFPLCVLRPIARGARPTSPPLARRPLARVDAEHFFNSVREFKQILRSKSWLLLRSKSWPILWSKSRNLTWSSISVVDVFRSILYSRMFGYLTVYHMVQTLWERYTVTIWQCSDANDYVIQSVMIWCV